jgi:hypothetical protein
VLLLLRALAPEEFRRVVASTAFIDQRWVLPSGMSRVWGFTSGLLSSGYLYAGWLRYPAPVPLIAAVYAAATVGLVLTIAGYRRLSRAPRQALQLAAIFAVISWWRRCGSFPDWTRRAGPVPVSRYRSAELPCLWPDAPPPLMPASSAGG